MRNYKFGFDALRALPYKEGAAQADSKITKRLVDICSDFRLAIAHSGLTLVELGDRTDQTNSSILKSLNRSFSMKPGRLVSFCNELFPGKTLDEIFFGKDLPMELPNIDKCYLTLYGNLFNAPSETATANIEHINSLIASKGPEVATPFSRYFGVRQDRGTDDPILSEYRNCAAVANLTSYSMWHANESNVHVKTLMKAAFFCGMSLDFLLKMDYSCCNLYTVSDSGQQIYITASDKAILRKFCQLSRKDKALVLTEMLKLIDCNKTI